MKKVTILLFAIFAFASASFAQTANLGTFSIPDVVRAPGAITVSLDGASLNSVTSLDLFIEYNPTLLTFTGITNANASLPGIAGFSVGANRIYITWSAGTNPAVSGALKLLDLQFNYTGGGISTVVFDTDVSLVNQGRDATFVNGSVSPEGSQTLPLSNWAIFVGLGLIVAFLVVRFRKLV